MVMAWVLGEIGGLDTNRLLKLMLLHDLPEAEAGDATPYADVLGRGSALADAVARWRELVTAEQLAAAKRQKRQSEEAAVAQLSAVTKSGVVHSERAPVGAPNASS